MIAVVDYGVGNLFSLECSLKAIGAEIIVTSSKEEIKRAEKIILPGVGAFEDAREKLRSSGLDEVIIEEVKGGKPLLGICLGMQMLFEKSYEYGTHVGLGLLKGEVVSMRDLIADEYKIPHIGWNALNIKKQSPVLKYVKEGDCVYFVHSYCAVNCLESLVATSEYGIDVTACVQKDNVYGCQFHPEKSGNVGLNILKAFVEV